MVFCKACARDVPGFRDGDGLLSCSRCGKVLKFDNFSTEVTFVKNASGLSQISGSFVKSVEVENLSRQRLYDKAYDDLIYLKNGLGMGENVAIVNQAMEYYRIVVERNFTRGRRTDQVQAACLYIACRENRRPYLLIDFSNYLRINIYVLGAVFLQLCKVLNLTEHPICQKLLDPSIFIHKYTACLAGEKNKDISELALTIIASMNRDWMQTGRRPSGLWGAALYIAALSHGLNCSKSDILRMVHVCEATLTKRLVEFENTESGSLTIEELNAKAEELKDCAPEQPNIGLNGTNSKELLCQHKGTNKPPFGFGLCKDCYAYFIGFEGGSDPPAFQVAERQRMEAEKQRMENSSSSDKADHSDLFGKDPSKQFVNKNKRQQSTVPENVGVDTSNGGSSDEQRVDDTSSIDHDESDNFSDIDDAEVDGYLHNEEEKQYKKIIWEEMNREYLEEQAAKEAAAAAAKEAWEANFQNCPEDLKAARELDAAVAAAVAKSKKERQQKRAAEARNLAPAQTASEAARQMLNKKRLGSKINYDVLDKLFDEPDNNYVAKKKRMDEDKSLGGENKLEDKNQNDCSVNAEIEDGNEAEDQINDGYDDMMDETLEYDCDGY